MTNFKDYLKYCPLSGELSWKVFKGPSKAGKVVECSMVRSEFMKVNTNE